MTITGGCLCEAVRYRISAEPIAARTCWCRACQYTGTGNATVNVVFPSGAVSVDGPLTDYACKADSGNTMHRSFCPVCGAPVFTQSEARPHFLAVRAGTLDDSNLAKPDITIWTKMAPSWALHRCEPSVATRPSRRHRCCRQGNWPQRESGLRLRRGVATRQSQGLVSIASGGSIGKNGPGR
jgi:hypothetical protein